VQDANQHPEVTVRLQF